MTSVLNDGFKVFTQEETRLIRAVATIFDLRRIGRKVDEERLVFSRAVVPVFSDGKQVGAAALFALDDQIKAFITFDYHTPERMDLQVEIPVYAVPDGEWYLRESFLTPYSDWPCDFVQVNRIELRHNLNGAHLEPESAEVGGSIGGKLSILRLEEEENAT